ncbi:uncharacterized protein LOC103696382 isoform X2 [Phoenix dactylifera]|uniref:Uncharacterized protein LOC103696382 isoform X2 n=1 Tax=Phoenix dactylifera TaxID=42345 RepID=A0A8B7BGG4_PHODC|nr:uncharacterized protein LOC103696382 isoform X2 [Phoenix dactylifera]
MVAADQIRRVRSTASQVCAKLCYGLWLIFRCSMTSEGQHALVSHEEVLAFIKSTFGELQGPNHCWLNNVDGGIKSFNQHGIFLVLVNATLDYSTSRSHHECIFPIERVKLLQQRYPKLNVFALQYGSSVNSIATHTELIQTIMEEYITYPVLISEKNFAMMTNGACYLLFEGSTNRLFHLKLDEELGTLAKAIEELSVLQKESAATIQSSNFDRTRQLEVIKEPHFCSFRNLLLYYPGCLSVDEDGNRIFISDSNHHRIIIADGDGKILDCIGSYPGFEDGEFGSAKLLRPAGSFYCTAENCLYFVDSENHAIRRADMEKRMLETVYPVCVQKNTGIWSWILDKLGLAREIAQKPKEYEPDFVAFPWHLMKIGEDDLLITNRSFETSWIISVATGEIKKVLRGIPNIMEIWEHTIMEKLSLPKEIYENWSPEEGLQHSFSLEGIPHAGLVSSIANLQNYTIFSDAAGQRVLKFHRESQCISCFQFSNLGVLGLPYWLVCPLERVCSSGYSGRSWSEHLHSFNVLPGRCNIQVYVDIPLGTELATPMEESCIWRQARGSAVELSGSGDGISTEKVGVAQQWFDELDNLAFSKPELEADIQDEEVPPGRGFQDKDKVHFDCAVSISPGTGEVVVSAVLYLKVKKTQDNGEEQKNIAERILDYQKHEDRISENACTELLFKTCRDMQYMIFMKPLHLRIRLECGDHPAAETNKETITTDSMININISLD